MIAQRMTFTQRVALLFDIENIEIDEGTHSLLKLDYSGIVERIQHHGPRSREVQDGIAYTPRNRVTVPKQHFLERGVGLQVKRTPKNSDPYIFADAVIFALNRINVVAFVGSDCDIIPFVPILHVHAVKVEVWGWPHKTGREVIDAVDEFVPLTPDMVIRKTPIANDE